jgi:CheY-like chemotaxis protein
MKHILIVEDDPDIAVSLAEVLAAEGYATAIATNGREALERLKKGYHPHLILLDLMMPIMNGWQFRDEQRKTVGLNSIPVVAISADGEVERKASEIHANGHLAKPLSVDTLLNEVERICGVPDRGSG